MWVRIGAANAPLRQAIIDTGAPAAIFSKPVWNELAADGKIEWVAHAPEVTDRSRLPRTIVHGGRYPFRLGRVVVWPVDVNLKDQLRPSPVLVQCVEDDRQVATDPEPLPRLLVLGMNGLLNGRTLTVGASADGATWAASLAE